MPRPALAAAFAAALSGPLGRHFGGLGPEVSLTALALVGWVALAGLPRPPPEEPGNPAPSRGAGARVDGARGAGARVDRARVDRARGAGPGAVLGLALPAVGLGLAADLSAGFAPAALLWTLAFALPLVVLLAAGADRARGSGLHGLAWWLAVPGLAIAPAVAVWGRAEGSALVAASPLGWSFLRALAPAVGTGAEPGPGPGIAGALGEVPWAALAVAAGLYALARAAAPQAPRAGARPGSHAGAEDPGA